eukprot:TRINITY_DN15509_c0_g1_i2.p1 TRINITY_DN15509_c0_g1~~TRINITY_DN15509_c0_g1_i2.p1  ORF type:complete len:440 (+),score=78.04 TRINITY_DN15509_c0_g1_i2:48-1367(+)
MCIRDRYPRRVRGVSDLLYGQLSVSEIAPSEHSSTNETLSLTEDVLDAEDVPAAIVEELQESAHPTTLSNALATLLTRTAHHLVDSDDPRGFRYAAHAQQAAHWLLLARLTCRTWCAAVSESTQAMPLVRLQSAPQGCLSAGMANCVLGLHALHTVQLGGAGRMFDDMDLHAWGVVLSEHPSLHSFGLLDVKIGNSQWLTLCLQLQRRVNWRRLMFSRVQIAIGGESFGRALHQVLAPQTRLEALQLQACTLNSAHLLSVLSSLSQNSCLTQQGNLRLDLSQCLIRDPVLTSLTEMLLAAPLLLRSLDLGRNVDDTNSTHQISGTVLSALFTALQHCSWLGGLNLSYLLTQQNESCLGTLADLLIKAPQLEAVHLDGCYFSDMHLGLGLSSCQQLSSCSLTGLSWISRSPISCLLSWGDSPSCVLEQLAIDLPPGQCSG